MTDRELMQQALEALAIFREWEMGQDYESNRETVLAHAFAAEEALRERLAQIDPTRHPSSFDEWLANPYTVVLQKSIAEDYVPRRKWAGLTLNDFDDLAVSKDWIAGARWAEAKLKEKNV